jgi:VEFS-Box of polycomb protein
MDEFEDVTPQEKRFAKMWNRFMTSHVVIADHAIPSYSFEFVRTHYKFLVEHDLRSELMLHFMGFWDSGLISSTHLMNLMAEFDKLSAENLERNVDVVTNSADPPKFEKS